MLSQHTFQALTIAALMATVSVLCGGITSGNHPVLQRALAAEPEADTDHDGVLSLEEYNALAARPRQKGAPQSTGALFLPVLPDGEVILQEFEDNSFREAGGWTREGEAFHRDLQPGTQMMRKRVGPYRGNYLLTTVTGSDAETGLLRSPEFLIELDYLLVTMSGGEFPQQVGVNLRLGDELVRSATGANDDYFEVVTFDLREFRGRTAQVELVDHSRGLWGHLNVDRIVLSDQPGGARIITARPAPVRSTGGLALTTGQAVRGPLRAGDQALLADGPSPRPDAPDVRIPQEEVLLALNEPEPAANAQPGSVHLLSGEVWQVEIGELEAGLLAINSALTGARKVPLTAIASIEFEAGDPAARREPGHLYRSNGEPIPGKLVWVRRKDIAIDCPLGVVPVPRDLVQRFVLAAPRPPSERTMDEIGLADGGLLFGTASLAKDRLVLNHDVLGEVTIDWRAVRYLRRSPAGVTWLDGIPMAVVQSIGPVLPPPPPAARAARDSAALHTIRIHPHTTVRIPIGLAADRSARFVSELAPIPGSRTDVTVSIRDGEAVLWKELIPAGSDPIQLPEWLLVRADLTIEVDFAGPLGFPAGIDLRDPHLLTVATPPTPPQPTNQN